MRLPSAIDWRLLLLAAIAVAVTLAMAALGMLTARSAPDTAGYLAAAAAGDPSEMARHPLYGLVIQWLGAGIDKPGVVAQVQAAMFIVGAFALYFGAWAGGLGGTSAFFLALSGLLSQSAILQADILAPEAPALALLMMAFAATLAASRSRTAFWWLLVPVALSTGVAYILRPSYLPAIFVLPLLWLLFAWRNRQPHSTGPALLLFVAILVPFVAQSAVRWRAVGDFNIVSFGGYQMSAMAGFMLTPELVPRLPVAAQPTAQAVLNARVAAENTGTVAPTPLNSTGVRSFPSASLGYFDIYARAYDPFLVEIGKLKQPGETWVAFDRRLRNFAFATMIARPGEWVTWVGGAASRLVGRMIVTNVPMLLALGALAFAAVAATVRGTGFAGAGRDIAAASVVAVAWLVSAGALTVLMTFPATRYIESAGTLMPAIPALLAAALIGGLWTAETAPDVV